MLTITKSANSHDRATVGVVGEQHREMVDRIERALNGREARIFPPDGIIGQWQIFVRHSIMQTGWHSNFRDALVDLDGLLQREHVHSANHWQRHGIRV